MTSYARASRANIYINLFLASQLIYFCVLGALIHFSLLAFDATHTFVNTFISLLVFLDFISKLHPGV